MRLLAEVKIIKAKMKVPVALTRKVKARFGMIKLGITGSEARSNTIDAYFSNSLVSMVLANFASKIRRRFHQKWLKLQGREGSFSIAQLVIE